MKRWFRARATALAVFFAIAALLTGGLGWLTVSVLRLEQEQFDTRAQAELDDQLRVALSRLDSRVSPILAREASRPYNHYSAFFAPSVVFKQDATPIKPGLVIEPTPLLSDEMPDWILLHFQTDKQGWWSPQVLSQRLTTILQNPKVVANQDNMTDQRIQLLTDLAGCYTPEQLRNRVEQCKVQNSLTDSTLLPQNPAASNQNPFQQGQNTAPNPGYNNSTDPDPMSQKLLAQGNQNNPGNNYEKGQKDFLARAQTNERVQKDIQSKQQTEDWLVIERNTRRNGETWFSPAEGQPTAAKKAQVRLQPMVPLWLMPPNEAERLVVVRLVDINDSKANSTVCQGMVLDWPKLHDELMGEVRKLDLFPEAKLLPVRDPVPPNPARTMSALPVELDPGPVTGATAMGMTPLRAGVGFTWAAALIALAAVGLGGSSLLELSDRRIRFVSAVTHELRTPLTTLRLYLDMLTGGLVRDEQQRAEYLQTLHGETDRLHRLVGNVLDFSRLENQRPRLDISTIAEAELLEQVNANWQSRCASVGKELVIDNQLPAETRVTTDVQIVQQVLGNLIDNACKYSQTAEDKRIWLRTRAGATGRVVIEVEDRGPGVPLGERGTIFRPFRRGQSADVTAGGVGLGLALARQWSRLLGGSLVFETAAGGTGACFRLELPAR